MNEPTPASQLVRKRQLATLLSVSPRTIDGWVSKRMIPFIEQTRGSGSGEVGAAGSVCSSRKDVRGSGLCEPERVATEADLERCNRLCTRGRASERKSHALHEGSGIDLIAGGPEGSRIASP